MNKELTEIAYILDRSGSMQELTGAAISGFNSFLDEQQNAPGYGRLSLVLFDHEYILYSDRKPLDEVEKLTTKSYEPRGSTALLDAIGRTINHIGQQLSATPEEERPATVIIAIYTDGYENCSREFNVEKIHEMIRHQTDNYQWKFLFLAANEDAITTAAKYGINRENASAVKFDSTGMKASSRAFSRMILAERCSFNPDWVDPELQQDAKASLSDIVQEEESNNG